MARIIKDDTVIVIAGKDKGKEGKVLKVLKKTDKVIVQGVNMVYRHMRKSQDHPQGARIQKEAPLHISNVMLKDPKTGETTRIAYQIPETAGGKARLLKKELNRMEMESLEFHQCVREGYLMTAEKYKDRFRVFDGALTESELFEKIKSEIIAFVRR